MAGLSKMDELTELSRRVAVSAARNLLEQKAIDVVVLDISGQSSFADYFVIATAQSLGHLRGLLRKVDESLAENGVRPKTSRRAVQEEETWVLLDCGDVIIHLMTTEAREFYALEKLWFESPRVEVAGSGNESSDGK